MIEIENVLPIGKENAIPAKELVKLIGCSDERELRAMVAKERVKGKLILSTCGGRGGYYLPANRSEVKEYCRTTERRAESTFRVLKTAREYLAEVPGQESIEEYGRKEG